MVGLLDIAPAVETVDVRGSKVSIYGVSAKGIAHLLGRFPELRMLMSGKEVAIEQLMTMGGDAVAAIIAAGCGYPGDEKAEVMAGSLPIETQADLLAGILKLTMPRGVGPFVEKLARLGGLLDTEVPASVPVMKSGKPLTNSSPAPTAKTKQSSGAARPAN